MTTKIIIDCDPGIDDAAAISVALNNPAFDVKLITTVAGNVTVDKTTKNALKLVHFFNKKYRWLVCRTTLLKPFEDAARIHGESGMPGYDFDELVGDTVKHSAMEALYHYAQRGSNHLSSNGSLYEYCTTFGSSSGS